MKKKLIPILICLVLASGCAGGNTTTATEPTFTALSSGKATSDDAALYARLESQDPQPADRVDLAVAIEGLDPASLPAIPAGPAQTYAAGDRRSFWTHNSDTFKSNNITAELMVVSEHAYFWQDVASQALNASGQLATEKDWQAAAESFDRSYELVRAVFGQEQSPGLDGDPRLFVIHSDSLGRVGGYFGQGDLLPGVVEYYSNQGQYFYISNTWSGGIASEYYKEVLAHEFQHMIQKNMDSNEDGWLNEGFSMLSQQVAGMRGDNSVAEYLIRPDQSLWYWSGEPLDYGQSYLYVDYLYEQMGQEFIERIASDPANGLASIDQALAEFDSQRNADELYADAMLAAYFNDPALGSGQYAFQVPTLPAVATRYEFSTLPAVYQGTVQQYGGTDIITFAGDETVILTFSGDERVQLIPAEAHSGANFWWSNRYDATFGTLTRAVDLRGVDAATLTYWAWYDIEEDWDYAYVLVSTDSGVHWQLAESSSSRRSDPNNQNLGKGLSGISGGGKDPLWIEERVDLGAYAGQEILLRFAIQNDLVVNNFGFAVDDLAIAEIGWSDDAEGGSQNWSPAGFILSHNYVPQVWSVQVVELMENGSVRARSLEIAEGGGKMEVEMDGVEKLVVFVIGQTRHTSMPASYEIEVR